LDEDHSYYIKKTTAVLSGYIGGANVVKLGQLHDHLDNNTRLEMNIQHILQLESKLNQYKDPMGGSYFMEDLTQQICEKIWNKL
jgi:methylmalonyl-CoA mutase